MAKKKLRQEKYWNEFTLYYEGRPMTFADIEDFSIKTKISGAVARDMLEGKCDEFKNWSVKKS